MWKRINYLINATLYDCWIIQWRKRFLKNYFLLFLMECFIHVDLCKFVNAFKKSFTDCLRCVKRMPYHTAINLMMWWKKSSSYLQKKKKKISSHIIIIIIKRKKILQTESNWKEKSPLSSFYGKLMWCLLKHTNWFTKRRSP